MNEFNHMTFHRRRSIVPARLMGLFAFDVSLPPNSTGTGVDTVSGSGGKARQVASIGDPATPGQQLTITARNSALIEGAIAAGVAIAGNPVAIGGSDGTNLVRALMQSAANLAAAQQTGAQMVELPGDWSVNHTPAAAAQATITKAAGAAGLRHVATSISATLATVGTLQTIIQLNLRDGATGAGTILWSKSIVLPVNGLWEVNLSGLRIVGSAATAMTLEFSAAGVAASVESVALTGHTV